MTLTRALEYQQKRKASRSSFPLLVSILLCIVGDAAARDSIHVACRLCERGDPNIGYEFCMKSLRAAPRSQCPDPRELGRISIKLVQRKVSNARSRIKDLLKKKTTGSFMRVCLQDCFELYSDAIPSLKLALKDYNVGHYDDSNIGISSVLDACETCEDGFKEKKGVISPLTRSNNDTYQLSAISLCIINTLRTSDNP